MSPWLTMLGVTAPGTDSLLARSHRERRPASVLSEPRVHRKVGSINGESAKTVLRLIMRAPYKAHPWDDLWRVTAVDHQIRDEFWDERSVLPMLTRSTSRSISDATGTTSPCTCPARSAPGTRWPTTRTCGCACCPHGATTWPWESMHVEALAWFDHWLKGRDTGIPTGRASVTGSPGPSNGGTATPGRPQPTTTELGLGADGVLAAEPRGGSRELLCLGTGLGRPPRAHKSTRPRSCTGRPPRLGRPRHRRRRSSCACRPPSPRSTPHGS